MKRLWFLLGVGVGFVLGSRAGSGPYRQLEANVRKVAGLPKVQGTVSQVRDVMQDKVNEAAGKIGDALPNSEQKPSTLTSH